MLSLVMVAALSFPHITPSLANIMMEQAPLCEASIITARSRFHVPAEIDQNLAKAQYVYTALSERQNRGSEMLKYTIGLGMMTDDSLFQSTTNCMLLFNKALQP